jgi:hypothetical protein
MTRRASASRLRANSVWGWMRSGRTGSFLGRSARTTYHQIALPGTDCPNRDGANPGHKVSRRAGPRCLRMASRPASSNGRP